MSHPRSSAEHQEQFSLPAHLIPLAMMSGAMLGGGFHSQESVGSSGYPGTHGNPVNHGNPGNHGNSGHSGHSGPSGSYGNFAHSGSHDNLAPARSHGSTRDPPRTSHSAGVGAYPAQPGGRHSPYNGHHSGAALQPTLAPARPAQSPVKGGFPPGLFSAGHAQRPANSAHTPPPGSAADLPVDYFPGDHLGESAYAPNSVPYPNQGSFNSGASQNNVSAAQGTRNPPLARRMPPTLNHHRSVPELRPNPAMHLQQAQARPMNPELHGSFQSQRIQDPQSRPAYQGQHSYQGQPSQQSFQGYQGYQGQAQGQGHQGQGYQGQGYQGHGQSPVENHQNFSHPPNPKNHANPAPYQKQYQQRPVQQYAASLQLQPQHLNQAYAGAPQQTSADPSALGPNFNPRTYSLSRTAPQGQSFLSESRRVATSPTLPMSNAESFQVQRLRKENSAKENRTKSLTASQNQLQASPNSMPPQVQNQRSLSNGSSHSFSFSSKSLSSLGKLSSLSTKKFSSSTSLQKDRSVSQLTMATMKTMSGQSRKPSVYPALLSGVAKAFKEGMLVSINIKDGLEYHDSFTGKAAIDLICNLIRTNDRNLALLLGRSLDAQKFIHDATYNHRLRDSANEVYNFTRVYSDVEFFDENNGGSNNNSNRGSSLYNGTSAGTSTAPYPTSNYPPIPGSPIEGILGSFTSLSKVGTETKDFNELSGVNGVFTILTECYSPTCSRNRLCYSIACPRRLEQQARLNMKPRGGLRRAVLRLSLHDNETSKTLWHETVDQCVLDKLDKLEKMRQELIYELIYTERDYVKDLEFMTDFYIMPLRNPVNNIIPERERDAFIRTVFGGVSDLLRLAKSLSEALTARQQSQKPVVESVADVLLLFISNFEPFIKYSGNKVFASFEHERQQQVNPRYARFLDAIEKKPESRKQDFSSFLIKGVQRPARYQLLLSGIIKNTKEDSPDYKNLLKAKEEIEKLLVKINAQTGEATDRHKIMVLHRLLGRQTLEERFNFKLTYNNRIIYQVTLSRKRDNEKIDLYLFEHALLMVKHKIQNKREVHKVFERPVYLPLLFMNSGYDAPSFKTLLPYREGGSLVSDVGPKMKIEPSAYNAVTSSQQKMQLNFFGLGSNPVHVSLFADDVTNQNQVLQQVQQQQKKLIEKHDVFSICKYETRRFTGNNRINCAVPCYGGKKLMYGTDSGVWVSTVRSISMSSLEKICSDPTIVISKPYVTQLEVLVEYSKVLVLSDKTLYEFDLSCTDSLDHAKNTRSGKIILHHVSYFKTGICDGKLLVCAVKSGNARAISIVEPTNPFDKNKNKNKRLEVREISFASEPVLISFLKTKLCIGCTKGFEILSLQAGQKESILDEADPSLDFATQRESVTPLAIHKLDKNFLLSYSEFSFFINRNGWRTKHDWGIFWEGTPQNIALFYPYLLAFDPGFIEIRDLESTTLIRALVGENIRYLHSNEHEALYACEENGYDIIVSIDFLNLKPKQPVKK